jgi:hypothetical protein
MKDEPRNLYLEYLLRFVDLDKARQEAEEFENENNKS